MSDPMTPEVRDWIKRTEAQPPDAHHSARQVMARLPEVRQRPRWWPYPLLYRKAQPAQETTDSIQYRPGFIPATNGHTPTVIGRTQTMLSPVKAIAAGALVFALGGVMLLAQPFDPQGDTVPVPGAASEPMDPATFTADAVLHGSYVSVGCETSDGVQHCRDEFQMAVDASDPRVSGTLTYGLNRDTHSQVKVHAGTVAIENDDGMWAGTFTGYWDEQGARIFHAQLVGQDGYDGWTMLLDDFCACNSPTSEMKGVIIPGDLPAAE